MAKQFTMSMFATQADLFKAKAEYFEAKYKESQALNVELNTKLDMVSETLDEMGTIFATRQGG